MRVKNIIVSVKDMKIALREFAETYERARKGERIIPHEELSFENVETLRKFLTEKRMDLLHVIKRQAPESIYELAKIVNRDLKSVNTDIQVLENLGLITLEKTRTERRKVRPRVEFDRLNVEIAI